MPKSSRHKSHKQSKHREHSDSEDDSKKTVKEASIRVSSVSGEKRKSSILHSRESKDLSGHANADGLDEFVASKRRKDRSEVGDRWNGGADGESKGESSAKSKTLIESKSKSSRKHDAVIEKKDDYAGLVTEKEESRSGKSELKRKSEKDRIKEKDYIEKERSEKDSSRKEASQYKDSKEKERGLDREKKERERGLEPRVGDSDAKRKQGSQIVDAVDAHKAKRSSENTERSLQDDLRSHKLEKEVDKRTERKGDVSGEKEKYQADKRVSDNRHMSSRGERDRDGRYKDERHNDGSYKDESLKDERHKNGSYRDRYKDDIYRESRHWEGNQKEDIDKDKRHRVEKYRDERDYRDRPVDKSESKFSRDDHDGAESRNKKSHTEIVNRDSSPIYHDRSTRYKDDKGKRISDDKDIPTDLRSRNMNEQRSDLEKKAISIGKSEPTADRERSRTRHDDTDSPMNHSRRRSPPNSSALVSKDQYRYSKQTDSTNRDTVHEERASHFVSSAREVGGANSGLPQKTNLSRSMDSKFISKDEGHIGNVSADRRMNSDARSPPVQSREKSPTASNERRPPNRSGSVRRNLDVEDSGIRRGNSRDMRDYLVNESKVGQDSPMDSSYSVNEHSQADGENISASSPFIRTNYQSSHAKSLLPPPSPYRPGPDNSSGFNSYDDDNRGKPNNRFKRINDTNMGNMGRVQGNSWKGVPTWPSPVSNGFMPFQHGPPPVGFHPMMQQFPVPPMFGGRPPSMELNHPFHYSDADRFSNHVRPFVWRNPGEDSCPGPLQGWDINNGALVDGSHMYGRQDWDHNRNNMSNAAWETNVDAWKGQNTGMVVKSPSVPKEENLVDIVDDVLADQLSQQAEKEQNQLDLKKNSLHTSAPKTMPEKTSGKPKMSKDNKILFIQHYLSTLDISEDLISPELYKEFSGLMPVKQNAGANLFSSRFLDVEGDTETRVKISTNVSCASLFPPAKESNFKRAMSLYKKGKDEMMAPFLSLPKKGRVSFSNFATLGFLSTTNKEDVIGHIPSPNGSDKQERMASTEIDMQEAENPITILNQENEGMEPVPQKLEDPVIGKEETIFIETQEKDVKMEVDLVCDEVVSKDAVEKQSDHESMVINEEKLVDTEAMMPELNDFESVNLSRIHHLPESTH